MSGLGPADAEAFARCIAGGGVALFPADTVYGLACAPERPEAVARLYALKGRAPAKPAALMFFDRDRALAALDDLADAGPRTRAAIERLLPGAVTLLLPALASRASRGAAGGAGAAGDGPLRAGCADGQAAHVVPALGLRVPALTAPLAALAAMPFAVLQSSANLAGGADARRVAEVPAAIRDGVDLVLDAGPLPGTPSTVVDLCAYEAAGTWTVVREGAVPHGALSVVLD